MRHVPTIQRGNMFKNKSSTSMKIKYHFQIFSFIFVAALCNGFKRFNRIQKTSHHSPTKLREGNVFTGVCLSTGGMPGPRSLRGGVGVGKPCSRSLPEGWVCKVQPPGRYTPGTDIQWWLPKRVVRILLECILV